MDMQVENEDTNVISLKSKKPIRPQSDEQIHQPLRKLGPNILIIEDDADVAEVTGMLINRYSGAKTDWADDGYAAMEALCENYYDYVIVDQFLPGIRGLQVLAAVDKAIENDPALGARVGTMAPMRVLFMSSEPIHIPSGLKLKYFVIQDAFQKNALQAGLARNLAF